MKKEELIEKLEKVSETTEVSELALLLVKEMILASIRYPHFYFNSEVLQTRLKKDVIWLLSEIEVPFSTSIVQLSPAGELSSISIDLSTMDGVKYH